MLVGDLSFNGQRRHAVPGVMSQTLYLDPGPYQLSYLQDVLHHEFFHMLDVRLQAVV